MATDYVEAYKWYILAGAQNNVEARSGMERLRRLMTTEEMNEALNRASSFKASVPAAAPGP